MFNKHIASSHNKFFDFRMTNYFALLLISKPLTLVIAEKMRIVPPGKNTIGENKNCHHWAWKYKKMQSAIRCGWKYLKMQTDKLLLCTIHSVSILICFTCPLFKVVFSNCLLVFFEIIIKQTTCSITQEKCTCFHKKLYSLA